MKEPGLTRRTIIKQGSFVLAALVIPFPLTAITTFNTMTDNPDFDVIIIGGSYAGLSAAMALGRALRKVLIIDSGKPCNRQTPHAHNFLTQDGEKPAVIAAKAKAQVMQYRTIQFHNGLAVSGKKTEKGFIIRMQSGAGITGRKLIFATGLKDKMPDIKGFSECWGISVIHCPYCHGYEVRHQPTGILANGDMAFHYARLIRNWTKDLTLFTNGASTLTPAQKEKITWHNIPVIEKEIASLAHENGHIRQIVFKDHTHFDLKVIYARPDVEQHCHIPEALGCTLTEQGFIQVDMFQKTSIADVFACGDSTSMMRSVANAVATGSIAGAVANNEWTEAAF